MDYGNIIIQVRDNIDLTLAMHLVNSVIANGRNKKGKFEWKTQFNTISGEAFVYARQHTKKDSFVVSNNMNISKNDLS